MSNTTKPEKSEWHLSPEESARVEAGHREMVTAESSKKNAIDCTPKQPNKK